MEITLGPSGFRRRSKQIQRI